MNLNLNLKIIILDILAILDNKVIRDITFIII